MMRQKFFLIHYLIPLLHRTQPQVVVAFLKQEIKAPTTQNVKQYSDCLSKLKEWRSKIPATIDDIQAYRLEQFIAEATALDSSDMKNLKQDKRYALAVTMLHFKLANGFDDIANV